MNMAATMNTEVSKIRTNNDDLQKMQVIIEKDAQYSSHPKTGNPNTIVMKLDQQSKQIIVTKLILSFPIN